MCLVRVPARPCRSRLWLHHARRVAACVPAVCLAIPGGFIRSSKNPAGMNLTGLEVLWRSEVGVSPFTGRFAHGRAQWARRGPPSNSAHPRGSRLRARARNIARRLLRGQALLCGARLDPARLAYLGAVSQAEPKCRARGRVGRVEPRRVGRVESRLVRQGSTSWTSRTSRATPATSGLERCRRRLTCRGQGGATFLSTLCLLRLAQPSDRTYEKFPSGGAP